jgi:uncharacterized membrane protein
MQTGLVYLMNGPMGDVMMRGGPRGGFFLGGLLSVVWTALLVLLILWIVRNWAGISASLRRAVSSVQTSSPTPSATQTPLEILQTRYASGAISREEYETIRRDLVGETPATPA